MKKLQSLLQNKTKLLPGLLIVGVLVTAGSISFAFSPKSPFAAKSSETAGKAVSYAAKETQAPVPTVQISAAPPRRVITAQTKSVSSTPIIPMPTVTQQSATATTSQNTQSPTNTPVPLQASNSTATPAQATQSQAQTFSMQINAPDGSSSFTVDYSDGMNVCDALLKAKDAGKIKSVTLDDSYMSTLHSKYVAEINGHANNWTFTLNGSQPLGCSLVSPKPNDTIVWKFG